MSKIKGQDLVVMFRDETDHSWKAVAYATDCELDINVSMLETGSQDMDMTMTILEDGRKIDRCKLSAFYAEDEEGGCIAEIRLPMGT